MAVDFNGVDQYYTTTNLYYNLGSACTLFFQFYSDRTTGAYNGVIGRRNGFTWGWELQQRLHAGPDRFFRLSNDKGSHPSGANAWSNQTWHWVAVRANSVVNYYVDGVDVSASPAPSWAAPTANSSLYPLGYAGTNNAGTPWSSLDTHGPAAICNVDLGADACLALSQGVSPLIVAPGVWDHYWRCTVPDDIQDYGGGAQPLIKNGTPTYAAAPPLTDRRRRQIFYIPPPPPPAVLTASEMTLVTATDTASVIGAIITANETASVTATDTASVVGAIISASETAAALVTDTASVVGAIVAGSELSVLTATDTASVIGAIVVPGESTIVTATDGATVVSVGVITALESTIVTATDTATVVAINLALALDPAWTAQQIVDHLTSNLAAELTAIETAQADNVELGTPIYHLFPQGQYAEDLNIVVYPVRSEPIVSGDPRQTHVIHIEVIAAGQQSHATSHPSTVLTQRVQRAAQAVVNVLNNNRLSNQVDRLFVQETVYDAESADNEAQQRRVGVELLVHVSEVPW